MFNLFGSKLLDGIFLYVQFVSTSCLVQTFVLNHLNIKVLTQTWSTDKLNIQEDSIQKFWTVQVEHTGWFHPSFLDGITLYVQIFCSSCLVPNFWMEIPCTCMFNLSSSCLVQNFWIEPPMKYWQVEHKGWFHPKVLNQTWSTDKLNMQSDCIQNFWTRHATWMEIPCMFSLSGSKLLDGIFLYVQFVSTSCLVQNLDGITCRT
jgi:hypothetical protein